MSRALSRLEREAGTPLFDRVNRRLHLNSYGQIVLEHARRSVAEMSSATERIAAMRDPDNGTVRWGFRHSLANWLVPDLLRRFRLGAPNVVFDLHRGAAHEIAQLLSDGRIDLATTSPRPVQPAIAWHELYVERLSVAVPPGHRFAKRPGSACRTTPMSPSSPCVPVRAAATHRSALVGRRNPATDRVRGDEIPAMEGLVAAGFGVAMVPVPRPDRGEPLCAYLPLADPDAKRRVGLAWLPGRSLPPATERFAAFTRSSTPT